MSDNVQEEQLCHECGDSVAWGSGKFVNRIPAFGIETACDESIDGWLCQECDDKTCPDFEFVKVHSTNIVPLRMFANAVWKIAGRLMVSAVRAGGERPSRFYVRKYNFGQSISNRVSRYTSFTEMRKQ